MQHDRPKTDTYSKDLQKIQCHAVTALTTPPDAQLHDDPGFLGGIKLMYPRHPIITL